MSITKLLVYLAIGSLFFSGCNMPRTEGSPSLTYPTSTPTSKPTEIPGEPLYWIQLAYSSYGAVNDTPEGKRSRLSFVSNQEEIPKVENLIRPQDLPRLQHADYGQMLVLIIFSGWRDSTGHEILVDQVVKNGTEVFVAVTFTEPPAGEPAGQIITSPYLVFEIQKIDLPEKPSFILIGNGKEVDRIQN